MVAEGLEDDQWVEELEVCGCGLEKRGVRGSVLQINKGFSNGEGVNRSPYALRLKQ